MGIDILDSAPSIRPARFPKRASLAISATHAMVAAPDVVACKMRFET